MAAVTVEAADGHCAFHVRDDGQGAPAGLLPTVFDGCTRGDAAHGGRVEVAGAPGYTPFTVTLSLPAARSRTTGTA
ncbi:ATP-binding protein [Streptomyces sp900105755]|uniref:ATP-binding protein n=1 Tax=Streptomyces sp. 900105755 TaxID=3154389 RepID=UPI0033326E92